MSSGELALVVAVLTAMGVLINALIAGRRAPYDIRKSEAETKKLSDESSRIVEEKRKLSEEADQVQISTSLGLVNALECESKKLREEVNLLRGHQTKSEKKELELENDLMHVKSRLVAAETRAAQAENRLAEADRRANEFRQDIIRVGTELDRERKEYRAWINKIALIVSHLISQLESSGAKPDLSADDLALLAKLSSIGDA